MEQEIPDYDMDSDDERWLQAQKPRLDLSPLKFEEMMDRLEKSSGQTVVTLGEAKALLKEDDELTIAVFDYWLNKRLKTQHPLILTVRTEHRSGQAANNPYLAFRRRTEKMQTRKNRKNDEVSYEKMLKLRRDLFRAVTLLELVKRREKCKRESVHLTVEVFEKRYQAQDFSGAVAAEAAATKAALAPTRPAFTQIFHNHNQSWADVVVNQAQAAVQHHNKSSIKDDVLSRREKRQYKKRKHKSLAGRGAGLDGLSSDEESSLGAAPLQGTTSEPEEQEDDGPFAFRRNRLCTYHKPLPTLGNWPWCPPEENGIGDKRFRFTLTSLSNKKCVGFARRRMGRGGRVILDRVQTDYDKFWRGLDFSIIEPQQDQPSTSNSSGQQQQQQQDLSRIRVQTDSARLLRTKDSTSTYNKYSAVAGGSQSTCSVGGGTGGTMSNSDFFSNSSISVSGDSVTEIKVKCKSERADNAEAANEEDTVEFLKALRRDWLHFRPKTPPTDYESPCHLLPPDELPFSNNPLPSFHMEIESLDPPGSSALLLDQSPFVTDLFELDRRWQDENTGRPNLGPQDPIFEDSDEAPEAEELDEDDDSSWKTVGVSSFTLTDAGGEASIGKTKNSELEMYRAGCDSKGACGGELQEIGSTNGLISQIGFSADVPSLSSPRNNKLQPYAYSNTHSSPGTLSLLTSAQSVTLNSHSANNILEFPLTAAVDVAVDSQSSQTGSVVTNNSAQKTPNGGVRNNKNSLVMEVT